MTEEGGMREAIAAVVAEFPDPETGRRIGPLGQVHGLELSRGRLTLTLGLTSYAAPLWKTTQAELTEQIRKKFPELTEIVVQVEEHVRPPEKLGPLGLSVKSVIAVGSGKGGVGKSTIAAILAFGLSRAGAHVGLLDADVYGPSIPHLIGSDQQPTLHGEKIQPVMVQGVPVMSMGFLVPAGEAVIWRGPMLHNTITQFLRDTDWGELDYLIIDIPPGTGDVPLSLAQLLPVSAAVVVCTPQDVALLDATKAITMFRRVNIDVVGMVENMSYFVCPTCGTRHEVFSSGGARRRAEQLGVPFLGEVPLSITLRILGDERRISGSLEDPAVSPYLENLCMNLVRELATRRQKRPSLPPLSVLP